MKIENIVIIPCHGICLNSKAACEISEASSYREIVIAANWWAFKLSSTNTT